MKKLIYSPELGLLLFRLFIGLTMALAHGLGKIPPGEQMISGLSGMGFPIPLAFAWCAALSELLGGVGIALGLFTRLSALFVGITMAVAAGVAHAADPFRVKEMALLYLACCVLLFFTGAGKYSLDWIVRKK